VLDQHPCLGLSALGLCSYNPGQPAAVYFSIGEAISALALTLAVQQFLAPIYRFRLRAYGLKIGYLILPVFFGFLCALIAALLPSLPLSRAYFFEYPNVWELFGGLLIAGAYAIAGFVVFRPAQIYRLNLGSFIRAAAILLSEADETDRVRFAEDLLGGRHQNLERLIRYAYTLEVAEHHESTIEFERLGAAGLPLSFSGRPPISAFFRFAHRKELAAGSDAAIFLRILSDPHFCSVLVRRRPWLTASVMEFISAKRLHTPQLELFIQEIGAQSLLDDESIITKEVGLEGFGATPFLSNTLFSDWFILREYDPLRKLHFGGDVALTEGFVSRFRNASKLVVETAIKNHDFYDQRYMFSVHAAYENLFRELSYRKTDDVSIGLRVSLHMGVREIYKALEGALDNMRIEELEYFYAAKAREPDRWSNLITSVTAIVYDSLETIANSFDGVDDPNWTHAIQTFMDIFPVYGSTPIGFDPLQQHLALKLIEKLKDNMQGYYPAISRVLLAVIGPYDRHQNNSQFTAFSVLRDAVYKELQKLHQLWTTKPDQLGGYFPSSVSYDPNIDSLSFTYRAGDSRITNLGALTIPEVNLLDPRHRRWRFIGNGMGWPL
jgi:hypothetical protein